MHPWEVMYTRINTAINVITLIIIAIIAIELGYIIYQKYFKKK